nr:disulfide bond formation protein B [Mongoliimonas terrestris]
MMSVSATAPSTGSFVRTTVWKAPLAAGFLVGLAAIATAWGYQIIGGYVPCKLCYQERIPYYVGLPLILLSLLLAGRAPGAARLFAVLGGIAFLVGTGLGGYHAGAEWGFWPGPNDCGGGTGPTTDAGNLLAQLQSTRLVSCTEASWRMLGLSFAGWNAVLSAAVAAAAFLGAAGNRSARAISR